MLNKPMLAATLENVDLLNYLLGLVVSPKLDGIRCLIANGVAVSRSLKPIRNKYIQHLFSRPEYNGLDGELIVGDPCSKTCYRDTNSGVMSEDGEPDVRFHIFDCFTMAAGFKERYAALPHDHERVVRVPHHIITTKEQLLALEEKYLALGYEGLMIRHPEGPYKQNRSTLKEGYLLKLKRMISEEAEILEVIELMHNNNTAKTNALGHTERSTHKENLTPGGTAGAIRVRNLSDGCVFQIGTGFTQDERDDIWARRRSIIGEIVSYTHFPIGRKDLPRHPSYKGFRSKDDM